MEIFTMQNIVLFSMAGLIAFLFITSKALNQIADEMDAEESKQ